MCNRRHGAAGLRAVVTAAVIDVDGWCAAELDPLVVTRNLREELHITKRDPDDLVDD